MDNNMDDNKKYDKNRNISRALLSASAGPFPNGAFSSGPI